MDMLFSILSPHLVLAALCVALLAGVIKGIVGFAMPMIMISGLSSIVGAEWALAGLILPTVLTNMWQALRQGRGAAWASVERFRVFLLCGLVTLLLSAQLVRVLPGGRIPVDGVVRDGMTELKPKRTSFLFSRLAGSLIALTVIDIKSFRLPNYLTFPLIALGLLQGYVLRGDIWPYAIGAAAGYLAFLLVEVSFKRLRGIDGLGRGDAKLLAGAGAWCGWMWLPQVVLIGSLAAIAAVLLMRVRKADITAQTAIPFGPFLAFGIAIVWGVQMFHPFLG